ncbi:MAG: hypothetical protein PF569_04390 [Candidatus Woesearchaeota archaeon]|jgi:hypothetical protein|nr:hypothetical protein [Candidatus Woesearchaeota archaeon]
MRVYHVTEYENLDSILKIGLIPGMEIKERIIEKIYYKYIKNKYNIKEDIERATEIFNQKEYNLKERYSYIWFFINLKEAKSRARKQNRKVSILNYIRSNVVRNKNLVILELDLDPVFLKNISMVKGEPILLKFFQKFYSTRLVTKEKISPENIVKVIMSENLENNNLIKVFPNIEILKL